MMHIDMKLEQRRRNLKRDDPDLYDYIILREQIRTYDAAGDLASGALCGEAAANRLWRRASELGKASSEAARAHQRAALRTSVDRP